MLWVHEGAVIEGLLPFHAYCIARHFSEQELFYLPPHYEEF